MAHRRSGFQKKIEQVHWTNFGSQGTLFGVGGTTVGATLISAQHLPETLLDLLLEP